MKNKITFLLSISFLIVMGLVSARLSMAAGGDPMPHAIKFYPPTPVTYTKDFTALKNAVVDKQKAQFPIHGLIPGYLDVIDPTIEDVLHSFIRYSTQLPRASIVAPIFMYAPGNLDADGNAIFPATEALDIATIALPCNTDKDPASMTPPFSLKRPFHKWFHKGAFQGVVPGDAAEPGDMHPILNVDGEAKCLGRFLITNGDRDPSKGDAAAKDDVLLPEGYPLGLGNAWIRLMEGGSGIPDYVDSAFFGYPYETSNLAGSEMTLLIDIIQDDFNKDGKPEIAILNYDFFGGFQENS